MKSSFVRGAVILMAANAVSKILGAFLKVPLTYIIHEEGMAIYNTAFSVYAMMLSFVVSGIPFAVTKLTAAENARKNEGGAKSIVMYASVILTVIGIIGTVVMWIGAKFFALAMKEPNAVIAIRAIAPSVLFVALGAAAKSGFQGANNMVPTALSQFIEALIKLAAGYYFAVRLVKLGTEWAAAGAVAGVSAGEAVATAMLVLGYCISYRRIRRLDGQRSEYTRDIMTTAAPMIFMAAAGAAISVLDTSVIRASLLRSGLTNDEARYLYGAYTGYAMTVLNLPSGFLATFGVSIVPLVSAAAAVGNMDRVKSLTRKGLCISASLGLLSAAVIALGGNIILDILFRNTASGLILRLAAPSVAFICIMQLSSAILQAMGHANLTFISMLVTGGVKLLFAALAVSRPNINIYGAALGQDFAYMAGMMLNMLFLFYAQNHNGLEISDKI